MVFDIGQVLVRSYWKEYMKIKGTSKDSQHRIKDITLNSEWWNQIDLGKISLEEMILEIQKSNPEFKKELLEFFKIYSEFTIIDKEVEQFLIDLKSMDYNIFILSNYGREFFEELEKKAEFLSYVDGRIISYEVNVRKPDLKIFALLIEKYHIKPEESIFIDDNKENIMAARQMKFYTILFRSLDQVKTDFSLVVG